MSEGFDPRVVPATLLRVVRAIQDQSGALLGGCAALAGHHLRHRRTRDADLFFSDRELHRETVRNIADLARSTATDLQLVRDAGTFARAALTTELGPAEIDLVYEPLPPLAPVASPDDLALALQKDAGIDPAILGWLLGDFPVRPMPAMLLPLTEEELNQYRLALRERFRRLAGP